MGLLKSINDKKNISLVSHNSLKKNLLKGGHTLSMAQILDFKPLNSHVQGLYCSRLGICQSFQTIDLLLEVNDITLISKKKMLALEALDS